jgi:hypothetical protein
MTDSNLLELAKLGEPQAIETLMNQSLQSRGMNAKVNRQDNVLEVILEAERVPNRQALIAFVQKGIANLGIQSIQSIRILGQQRGVGYPAWMQELQLDASVLAGSPELTSSNLPPLTIQPETATESKTLATDGVIEHPADPSVTDAATEPDPLDEIWQESPREPDVLQELLANQPSSESRTGTDRPSTNLTDLSSEPDSDQGLLDFLNDLPPAPAHENFPSEPIQPQSNFAATEPSQAELSELSDLFMEAPAASRAEPDELLDSDTWLDSTELTEQPDDDLLSFLNQSDMEPAPAEISSPFVSADAVLTDRAAGSLLDSQLDDLFADPQLTYTEEVELLPEPEQPSAGQDLQPSTGEPDEPIADITGSSLQDPWTENENRQSASSESAAEPDIELPGVEPLSPEAEMATYASLHPTLDQPEQVSEIQPAVGDNQFDQFSDEYGTVEEIPPDFLLDFQDEAMSEFPELDAAVDLPTAPGEAESSWRLEPDSSVIDASEVDHSPTEPVSNLAADLAALDLSATPEPNPIELQTASAEPSTESATAAGNVATPSEPPADLSQDALEAGLGDFREGFIEPLPTEFLDQEHQPPDWQAELREPLNLDDEQTETTNLIDDNLPDYSPPYTATAAPTAALDSSASSYSPAPLPDSRAAEPLSEPDEVQNPPWLFTTVLIGLCVLIAGLLGFSLFWSKLAAPPSPPPASEPPAAPSSPSPSSANPRQSHMATVG